MLHNQRVNGEMYCITSRKNVNLLVQICTKYNYLVRRPRIVSNFTKWVRPEMVCIQFIAILTGKIRITHWNSGDPIFGQSDLYKWYPGVPFELQMTSLFRGHRNSQIHAHTHKHNLSQKEIEIWLTTFRSVPICQGFGEKSKVSIIFLYVSV